MNVVLTASSSSSEEDSDRLYSTIIAKCFLTEGILAEHSSCLLVADERVDCFMKNLPAEAVSKMEVAPKIDDSDKLDIAWRYAKNSGMKNLGISSSSTYFGHKLDISRSLDAEAHIKSSSFHAVAFESFLSCHSCDASLEAALDKMKSAVAKTESSVLRIVIPAFGSPAWGVPNAQHVSQGRTDLSLFLTKVRILVKNSSAVALITVPGLVMTEFPGLRQRLCALADYAFQLESFAASEKESNPIFKDYRGAFRVLKLPLVNAACPMSRPDTLDLAFKVRAQNFLIEPLCLPPDLSESASRTMNRSGPSCGTGPGTVADF